jgi:hypothetical protein
MSRTTAPPAAPAGVISVVPTPPNPWRLLSSLRDSGYSTQDAIADLIDNSVDNGATRIQLFVEPEAGTLAAEAARIVVADDGTAMSSDDLREALKLGSETEHDPNSDLGKFGMGLITASISMGRRLVVLTKTTDGDLVRGVHDLDTIYQRNEFVSEISPASKADISDWERYCANGDHGTVILVEKCDQLQYSRAGDLINRLKKHLGEVFRRFIVAKSKQNGAFHSFITINGESVYAVDPLMLEENKAFIFPGTRDLMPEFGQLLDDFTFEVPIDPAKPESAVDAIQVRIVHLPDPGAALAAQLGINAANAGIYVMRNQRQIASSQTLQLFQKVQALNRFRAELHVPASLDKRVGINWTKHRIEPDQGLQELLKKKIGPSITSLRKNYNKRTADNTTVDHKVFEALIAKKAKLLTLPRTKKIERVGGERSGVITPKHTDHRREGRGELSDRVREKCEFKESHMTVSGPLWEPEMRGSKIIISFNIDHPLWTRFVLEEERQEGERSALLELLHLFSYCLTTAEYGAFGEDEWVERLINMRQQLSNNMRVLLT